ncbi:homing endonuclease [Vibrio phage TCU-VP03-AIR1]
MFYTVYKITNLINGRIYVGVHKTENLEDDYMGSGKLIKRAIKKYGVDNFTREYIAIFDNADDMYNMESVIVDESFIQSNDTYNISLGGNGSFEHIHSDERSLEWKKHAAEATKRSRVENPELFARVDSEHSARTTALWESGAYDHIAMCSFKGMKHTDETKRKISENSSKHQRGAGNSQYGTCWIHSLTEKRSKKIPKDELDDYLELGWVKGRKMKF